MNENAIAGMGATPLIKNADGTTLISLGTVALVTLGAIGLYFFIPEKKRSNLFK